MCLKICAAFSAFLFLFCLQNKVVHAAPFYSDESLTLEWPGQVISVPCDETLMARVGSACARLGTDGSLGAVFLSVHDGYELGSREALLAHLESSRDALADIPRIQVMQARILGEDPLLGIMDVLRQDGTLESIDRLKGVPVRQTSILIPVENRLAQIFIYLPFEGEDAISMYSTLVGSFEKNIVLNAPPVAPQVLPKAEAPEGTLAVLRPAVLYGTLIALLIALGVIVSGIVQKKRRAVEDLRMHEMAMRPLDTGYDLQQDGENGGTQ